MAGITLSKPAMSRYFRSRMDLIEHRLVLLRKSSL